MTRKPVELISHCTAIDNDPRVVESYTIHTYTFRVCGEILEEFFQAQSRDDLWTDDHTFKAWYKDVTREEYRQRQKARMEALVARIGAELGVPKDARLNVQMLIAEVFAACYVEENP